MKLALEEAEKAFFLGEVPVGAVLVYKGNVISRAHNLVEIKKDATAHAEVLCLREGMRKLNNWRLIGATLYSTLEPCSLCAGAMLLARLSRLVWGAPDLRHGAHGSWVDLLSKEHPMHRIEVTSHVLAEESAHQMRSFFQQRRGGVCTSCSKN